MASSARTATLAAELGLDVGDLDGPLDLAVDGADAIERGTLHAIKGLGGALTREKLVALAARRFMLVGDDSKLVDQPQRPLRPARAGRDPDIRLAPHAAAVWQCSASQSSANARRGSS